MIDQLAIDYADSNIVYVDHSWPNPTPHRWEIIRYTAEGMGLTWAMVDSGQMYSRGVENTEAALEAYTEMTEYAIAQEPLADIQAEYFVRDDMAYFKVQVKNLSDVVLSNDNNAAVHAFLKESGFQHPKNTSHHASRGVGMTRIAELQPDATGTYYVAFPLLDINNWDNVEAVAFVDYQTAPDSIYDQLNAARATKVEPVEPTLTVEPKHVNRMAPIGFTEIAPVELTVTAPEGVNWQAMANQPWVTLDNTTGGPGDTTVTVTIALDMFRPGENLVTIYFADDENGTYDFAQISVWLEYDTGDWENLLFKRIYYPIVTTND